MVVDPPLIRRVPCPSDETPATDRNDIAWSDGVTALLDPVNSNLQQDYPLLFLGPPSGLTLGAGVPFLVPGSESVYLPGYDDLRSFSHLLRADPRRHRGGMVGAAHHEE